LSYGNHAAEFTLLYVDGEGEKVPFAFVSMVPEDGKGWTLPVELVKGIETDTIIMDFGPAAVGTGLRDVMFFTKVVPEPATMTLLALGGLAMLRRRGV